MKKNKKFMGLLIPAIITLVLGFVLLVPGLLLKSEITGSVGFDEEVAKTEIETQLTGDTKEIDTLFEVLDGVAGAEYDIDETVGSVSFDSDFSAGYSIWFTPKEVDDGVALGNEISYSINVEYNNVNIINNFLREVENVKEISTSTILSKNKNIDIVKRNIEEQLDIQLKDLILGNEEKKIEGYFKFTSEFIFTGGVSGTIEEEITPIENIGKGTFTIVETPKVVYQVIQNSSNNPYQYNYETIISSVSEEIEFEHEIIIEYNFVKQIILLVIGSILFVSSIVLFPVYGFKRAKQKKQIE